MQIEVSAKDGCVWSSSSISVCFHDSTFFLAKIASPHKLLMLCLLRTFPFGLKTFFPPENFPRQNRPSFSFPGLGLWAEQTKNTKRLAVISCKWRIYADEFISFCFCLLSLPFPRWQNKRWKFPSQNDFVRSKPTIDFHTQFPQLQLFWFSAFPSVFTTA